MTIKDNNYYLQLLDGSETVAIRTEDTITIYNSKKFKQRDRHIKLAEYFEPRKDLKIQHIKARFDLLPEDEWETFFRKSRKRQIEILNKNNL